MHEEIRKCPADNSSRRRSRPAARDVVPSCRAFGGGSGDEASAVNPDHDGEFFSTMDWPAPTHSAKDNLRYRLGRETPCRRMDCLAGNAAEFGGLANALPLRGGNRRFPAQVADWRQRVGDSEKRTHRAVIFTFDHAGRVFTCGAEDAAQATDIASVTATARRQTICRFIGISLPLIGKSLTKTERSRKEQRIVNEKLQNERLCLSQIWALPSTIDQCLLP